MFDAAKFWVRCSLVGLVLSAPIGCSTGRWNQEPETASRHLHHLVVIWLKKPGDQAARQAYIDASRALANLPGVLAYDVGVPAAIERDRRSSALDDSYDIAVAAVFESAEAYTAFLRDPAYQRHALNVLRPLVERYKVYDFIE